MDKQIWQIEESIMLVDLYIRTLGADRERLKIEQEKLSRLLRNRAKILGMNINDTYRNYNGIEMRLKTIKYLEKGKGLSTAGKSSKYALKLYHVFPEAFFQMVKEFHVRFDPKDE